MADTTLEDLMNQLGDITLDSTARYCPSCSEAKPADQFAVDHGATDGLQTWCRVCKSGQQHARKHGMTVYEYNIMVMYQGGVCAICGAKPTNRRLSVDHRHSCCATGCVGCRRALLCSNCNTGIGMLKESPEILQAAIEYITKWGS